MSPGMRGTKLKEANIENFTWCLEFSVLTLKLRRKGELRSYNLEVFMPSNEQKSYLKENSIDPLT
jgi:hypothetical protein